MSDYYGDFPINHAGICIPFDSFAGATGASSAASAFANTDVKIFKDGSDVERSSAAGITVTTSFNGATGLQLVKIDISDNTDVGFYAAGHEYNVAVDEITIDTQTVRFWIGSFSIERAGGALALVKTIKAQTDNLPADPADASDIAAAFATVNATLATISGFIDTEVAAIKAKTDNLPVDPADASDIAAAFATVNATLATISAFVDTEIATLLTRLGIPVDLGSGATVAANLVDIEAQTDDLTAIKDQTDLIPGTQDGYTWAERDILNSAVLLGIADGMGTATGHFRALDDSKNRITATMDAFGNRTAVVRDAT